MKITRRQFGFHALSTSGLVLGARVAGAWAGQADGQPTVSLQPLAAQATRLADALAAVGSPLSRDELAALRNASSSRNEPEGVAAITAIFEKRVLLDITINPEARLNVLRGPAPAQLVQGGWRTFLVRVSNQAGVTAPLLIRSPQAGAMGRRSSLAVEGVHDFTNGAVDAAEARARWIALNTYDLPPMLPTLSGLPVEYRVLQIYSRDAGDREASLIADVGFGEQDLGFRSTLPVLFHCAGAVPVSLSVFDEHGKPATASLLVRDSLQRTYPAQGKRDLPDLAFEPQVYRSHGESLLLATGEYTIDWGRGPEYLRDHTTLQVSAGKPHMEVRLKRWVSPSEFGYYSGDTHIHAAGCSHYESPTEGVQPEVMARQVAGEALDVGSLLNWGPGFQYQRQFFTGHTSLASAHEHLEHADESTADTLYGGGLLRYDVEVSGFPSSHCGHLVLLRLTQDMYPGTHTPTEWPSWNLPILRWAKQQGAHTGYAHVGHGMVVHSTALPNYIVPPFNSSGANEALIDITHEGTVNFLSGCDLWPFAELNVWYHLLNCGFRIAFAGETDFPCITDECVGGGRSYVRLLKGLAKGDVGYSSWLRALTNGDAYFGDGRSHIFNMELSAPEASWKDANLQRTLLLHQPGEITVTAQVCARLEAEPEPRQAAIAGSSPYSKPYWHVERARIQKTRRVPVELLVNGYPVARTEIDADGGVQPIHFKQRVDRSSWVALRIYPSSHTNPAWVSVGDAPVRSSRRSALWCRKAVDACWEQKRLRIRPVELHAATEAYDHARHAYDRIVRESFDDGDIDEFPREPSTLPVT